MSDDLDLKLEQRLGDEEDGIRMLKTDPFTETKPDRNTSTATTTLQPSGTTAHEGPDPGANGV